MINKKLLKLKISSLGLSCKQVADALGLDLPTFEDKLNGRRGEVFKVCEAISLVDFLKISEPGKYFFSE